MTCLNTMLRSAGVALLLTLGAGALLAEPGPACEQPVEGWRARAEAQMQDADWGRAPLVLAPATAAARDPFFAGEAICVARSQAARGLARVEKPGLATWDPSSRAFYATANGALVRLEADGALPFVADDFQGLDMDLRLGAGLAVSREPGDRIVAHDLRATPPVQRVLLEGARYFNPRLSPDATRLLVIESRFEGGRFHALDLASGATLLVAEGYAPSWHPDGQRVVFARIEHDGLRITGGDLWEVEVASGRERRLTDTPARAEVEPILSEDRDLIVYVDALTDRLEAVPYPTNPPPGGGR
jgi:hypothetical protein